MQRIDVKIKETDQYAIFETYLKGLLPQGILGRIKKDEKGRSAQAPRRQYSIWPIPHPLDGAFIDFQGALAGIHYLGPLRTAAERFYIAQSATDPGMDSAGEFLPYVLRDRRDSPVVFCAPGTAGTTTESFQRALDIWLSYIRTGQKPSSRAAAGEISLESTKGVLVEVGVRSPGGEAHSLVDSGFGYSQVMPILARGLLAPNTSTLIVEQPELHLNPALQARLAEFFVGLARCGKQVIIETHSEHILNAMRVLAAETDKPIESAIYFVDVATGRPIIHQLEIKEDGTVANWPAEFFGEADELRARLLKAQRRFLGSDHRQE